MTTTESLDYRSQDFTATLLKLPLKMALAITLLEAAGFSPMWISQRGTVHHPGPRELNEMMDSLGYTWNENTQRWKFVAHYRKNGKI